MTDTHFHVRSTHLTVKSHGQDSKGHSLYSIENDYKYDYQQVSITEVTCAMLSTTMRSKRQSCSCALCIHVLHTHTYLHTLCSVFVYTQGSITFCHDVYVHTRLIHTYICIWVYLSDGTKMKKKKRGGMSPKGDDNDNRLLLLNAKPYDDDVSIGRESARILTHIHSYQTIIFNAHISQKMGDHYVCNRQIFDCFSHY